MTTKQVIVIRKDLNMRTGKAIAQGAHASMGALLSCATKDYAPEGLGGGGYLQGMYIDLYRYNTNALKDWLENSFTKITVYVNSEQELLEVLEKAKQAGLINCLITDNGATEFKGVPTITCCAIGPDYAENIDPITKHLKLL